MKRIRSPLCLLLVAVMAFSLMVPVAASGATNAEADETGRAQELGLTPADWKDDLQKEADFAGFDQLITSLVTLCDGSALSVWRKKVNAAAFPQRNMRRDDGLVLLMLAGEALGYNVYNARNYAFCTENQVDYDAIFSQLSWDYPYCDAQREIPMYFDVVGGGQDPIGNVPSSAVFWMQRRMDLYQRLHFLDCDADLNFHLDQPLTRKAAVAAAVRLYNSEKLAYDPMTTKLREMTVADEALLAAAEAAKAEILNNTNELPCQETAYYVSNSGSDQSNGRSPETAWATLDKVNAANLQPGDGVYFQRGGLWRGQLWAQEGVTYSAYGQGEKPKVFASPENGASPQKWTLLEGTDNIWVYHRDMMDCGILVFDDGERWGVKVTPCYVNGYLSTINEGQPFDVKTELTEDLMFFSKADSILYDGAPFRYTVMDNCDRGEYAQEVVGKLYLRCDAGNPGEVFDSIEFAVRQNIILPADDAVFHDLCLKYTGAHCIFGGDMGFDVSFCEIGWIGGSLQYYRYDNGKPELFGNGVECDGSYDHYSVTDCYIYQCFDAGVSNQDPSEDPAVTGNANAEYRDVIQRNVTYAYNVFAYNDMPIEIFFTLEDDAGYGRHRMENVLIEGNYSLYTGYGWASAQNGKAQYSAAYQGYNAPNAAENFRITNNVFYLSTGPLLATGAPQKWRPELDGNIYVQNEGGTLANWPGGEGYQTAYPYYYTERRDTATDVIRDVLGDENGIALKATTEQNTPSGWARTEVRDGFAAGLIPYDLASDYRANITRQEFCRLMMTLVEQVRGTTAEAPAANPFTDTADTDVLKAHRLGIVTGTSATTFSPGGEITRQEAATMLARTAKVLGLEAREGENFADADQVAGWAREGVGFTSGLTDAKSGKKVMGGTGNGNFSPTLTYTREQAYITALRLFHCVR